MNTRGHITIGGRHGNILIFIVYFSSNTCICSCNLSITNGKSSESSAVTMETKLKKSSFQEISGIFR